MNSIAGIFTSRYHALTFLKIMFCTNLSINLSILDIARLFLSRGQGPLARRIARLCVGGFEIHISKKEEWVDLGGVGRGLARCDFVFNV